MSPNTPLERTTILIAAVLLLASTAASAETPWEAYLRAPSPAAAAAVQTAAYSKPGEINERFEADLSVLENEVAAGDAESTKLTVRLMTQFRRSAAIAEFLDAILGRSIRPNPVAFLQATSGVAGCPYATPRGDFFVDRREARVAEALARANALRGVINPELQKKRDECIALLERAD